MAKMDRIDIKPTAGFSNQFFGNITNEHDNGTLEMLVKYPEEYKGHMTFPYDSIKATSRGVYVPTEYRKKKSAKSKTKRKSKKECGCK